MTTETWITGFEMSGDYELGDLCQQQKLPYAHIYIPILYFFVFLIGFIGNLFVIVLMAMKKGNKRMVDNFVLNLAVADLVFVCTLPLWALSAAHNNHWYFGESLCKVSSYIISVNRCSSILFLTGMGVERYLVVMKRVRSKSSVTKKCIFTTCGCIWALSLLLGIPSLLYRKLNASDKFCQDEDSSAYRKYSLALLILTFLLPLGVILFCYCSICIKLLSHISMGKGTKNSLKIIFTIISTFICSWLPFNAFKAFLILSSPSELNQESSLSCSAQTAIKWGLSLSIYLAFMNSCINPIIYAFMDHHFRRRVQLCCLHFFCASQKPTQGLVFFSSAAESSLMFASRNKPSSSICHQPSM
ncbi:PREDICTED: probable G-protein coupled receptor 25 [Gavialis gangeticus]|uniref:probable G-protein coupled receptor 25 n=1 Tax=Gavialis gangeticus TaxID=94835 RepID=UPI00092F7067|nr:PREDICTED: probable G-protein coupled receptor 25 [Gavialis gangeticus]